MRECGNPELRPRPQVAPGRDRAGEERSGSVEAEPPAHLVLVHDGVGVAAGDAGFVRQPVGALFAAQERGTRFETVKPLSEVMASYDRDTGDQAPVQIR